MDNSKLAALIAVAAGLVAVFTSLGVTIWYYNRKRGKPGDKDS